MKDNPFPTRGMSQLRSVAVLVGAGMLAAAAFGEHPLGYIFATLAVLAITGAWLFLEIPGIPALPVVTTLYYVYYVLPLLRNIVEGYLPEEYEGAGLAVALFLICSLAGWLVIARLPGHGRLDKSEIVAGRQLFAFVAFGFVGGTTFFVLSFSLLGVFGTLFGVVRSVMLTITIVACYLFGQGIGRKVFLGWRQVVGYALFAAVVVNSIFGLFLAGAAAYMLAFIAGYVLGARKIPFAMLAGLLAIFTILHAGKGEMRERYWSYGSQGNEISLFSAPYFMAQWVGFGISSLAAGTAEETAVVDRTSLLQQLVLIMHMTPTIVPYSNGATYEMITEIIVPRFIDPDKPISSSGVNYLSVRYGLQSVEATRSTTLSWGLIPEAFANYGWSGIAGVGFIFGLGTGFVTWLSIGAPFLSIPFIVSVAGMSALFNVEADSSLLFVTFAQSIGSALMFGFAMRFFRKSDDAPLSRRSRPRPNVTARPRVGA